MGMITDTVQRGYENLMGLHCSLAKKSCDNTKQCIKKQRHHFADKGPSSQSYDFSSSHGTNVRAGLQRRLSAKELMLSNCDAGEDF